MGQQSWFIGSLRTPNIFVYSCFCCSATGGGNPQSLPKLPQSLPKTPQRLPQRFPKLPKASQSLPKGSPRVSQSLPKPPKINFDTPKASKASPSLRKAFPKAPPESPPEPPQSFTDRVSGVTSTQKPGAKTDFKLQGCCVAFEGSLNFLSYV